MSKVQTIGRIGGLSEEDFGLLVECARTFWEERAPIELISGDSINMMRCQEEMYVAELRDLEIAYSAEDYFTAEEISLFDELVERSKTRIPDYDVDPLVDVIHHEYHDALSKFVYIEHQERMQLACSLFTKIGIVHVVRTRLADIKATRESDSSEQLAALAAGF